MNFHIDNSIYFRDKGLCRNSNPDLSMVPQANLLSALRTFVRECPLETPTRQNQNLVFRSPGECSGTIVLPLWSQTPSFNPRSVHWNSFLPLVEALRPLLEVAGRLFKSVRPYDYAFAENIFLSEIWMSNPPIHPIPCRRPSSGDCFSSLRLSANVALVSGPLGSGTEVCETRFDGSKSAVGGEWALVTWAGEGKPRLEFPGVEVSDENGPWDYQGLRVAAEDVVVLAPGIKTGSKPFVGESYQLELFVPGR
ncbi:hypothetical protein BJ878DRAFT_566843 [Calycina marina]|uniref:Uncharacterized protein n=1 Tax=Calycina marina TaxID=1763456 RepID=A0A9P7Z483_9HELO|nr:hypothetical protein BJ878DRAFT_566843 [Calycina marina]